MEGWKQNGQEIGNGQAYEGEGLRSDIRIDSRTYHLILGGMLLYGFILNTIILYVVNTRHLYAHMNAVAVIIIYFAMIILGRILMNRKSIPLMILGYSLVVLPLGFVLSVLIISYELTTPGIVQNAFILTSVITGIMALAAILFTDFFERIFSRIMPALGITLLVTIIVEIVGSFLGFRFGITDYIVVVLFMGYLGYDWCRAIRQERTIQNAVRSACEIYIDMVNVFIRLLSILSRSRRND